MYSEVDPQLDREDLWIVDLRNPAAEAEFDEKLQQFRNGANLRETNKYKKGLTPTTKGPCHIQSQS